MTTGAVPRRGPGLVELVSTMGTVVSVDVRTDATQESCRRAVADVAGRLRSIDDSLSPWKTGSWGSRLIEGRVSIEECPSDVQRAVELSSRLKEVTAGYFSPFWRRATNPTAGPDPTGLVKGWAAQLASDILVAHGLPDHVVNAAGDLVLSGSSDSARGRGWRVGISGAAVDDLVGVVVLDASSTRWAVATSGIGQLGHHVLDPHRGTPARAVASATTVVSGARISEAGATADACATALVAAGGGARQLANDLGEQGVRCVVVDMSGRVDDPHALLEVAEG